MGRTGLDVLLSPSHFLKSLPELDGPIRRTGQEKTSWKKPHATRNATRRLAGKEYRSSTMSKTIRMQSALAAIILLSGAVSFAQSSGEAAYKGKCQSCHGAQGMPNPGIAKAMGVKPASDPSVRSLSEAQMIADTSNGKGKMPAFKGKLSDADIKASVDYFRAFAK
jgi:cytochrome c6